jgi:hypothetical protein
MGWVHDCCKTIVIDDARVIGVHRISRNNALAWHYAMMMSVMMKNNDGHSRTCKNCCSVIVSSNAGEPTCARLL